MRLRKTSVLQTAITDGNGSAKRIRSVLRTRSVPRRWVEKECWRRSELNERAIERSGNGEMMVLKWTILA